MVSGIDFLRAKRKLSFEQTRLSHSLKIFSLVLLVLYCLVIGAAFSYRFYLGQESQRISQAINIKKQKIEQLQKIESLQFLLKTRVSQLSELFAQPRIDYVQILSYLEEISPASVVLTDISLSEKGKVSLTGMADNAVVLGDFLEKLTAKEVTANPFTEIVLSSTGRETDGTYNFSLSLETNDQS